MEVWVVYQGYKYSNGDRDDWMLDICASEEIANATVENWIKWQKKIHGDESEGIYRFEEDKATGDLEHSRRVRIVLIRTGACEWIMYERKLVSEFSAKFIGKHNLTDN